MSDTDFLIQHVPKNAKQTQYMLTPKLKHIYQGNVF